MSSAPSRIRRQLTAGRLAVLGVVIGGLVAIAMPASAEYQIVHCQVQVEPRSRCYFGSGERHSYNGNFVRGSGVAGGSRYLQKCERMHAYDNYDNIYSRRCNGALETTGRWDDFCNNCAQHENTSYLLDVRAGNDEPNAAQYMTGRATY